jgi:hypothetical protein
MTLPQFNTLKNNEQLHHVLIQGACIGERATDEHLVLLFQLRKFYVEVFFTPDCDEIIDSKSFDDLDELQPYLEKVSIHLVA